MSLLKREKQVSLNIKISENLDLRLKNARIAAREAGFKFNVSEITQRFLEKELKKVEMELGI